MENNIRYSYMSHWKNVPYKQITDFRKFYYEDKTNYAYYQSWDQIFKYHAGCGYEGMEVAPWDLMAITKIFPDLKEFRAFAKERDVEISGMFHGMTGGRIKENIPKCVELTKIAAEQVVALGGKHLNCCPGENYSEGGPLDEEGIKNTIECLNEMGRVTEDYGIKLGIHNEFFCIMNKENHKRVIDATDPRYVHYCLDTAQVSIIGEDLCKFYDDYHERIVTFHLKDTADPKLADEVRYSPYPEIQDDGHRWFWELGFGKLDFPGLFELLKKHGFKGWATVETDGTPDLLASMAHTSYYLNHVLNKIYR